MTLLYFRIHVIRVITVIEVKTDEIAYALNTPDLHFPRNQDSTNPDNKNKLI